MRKQIFLQVGETALRSPDGEPLFNVALYVKDEDVEKLQLNQESKVRDVCGFFYEQYKSTQEKSPPTATNEQTDFATTHRTKL